MAREPWALRCPRGHAGLGVSSARRGTYRCHTCKETYRRTDLTNLAAGAS